MSKRKSCIETFETGGGYYGELREAVIAEELEGWVEAHHIPSREAIDASSLYYINGGVMEAQKIDIDDLRCNFGKKYDRYIEQAITHTKNMLKSGYI